MMVLLGPIPPYCALVKYIGFADLDVIVFRKLYVFYNGAGLPINVKVATVTKFFCPGLPINVKVAMVTNFSFPLLMGLKPR